MKLLREADDYVSGQELCDKFMVSRTAVWKVINQLKEEGYLIEAVRNKGYHMVDSPDVLNKEAIESHVGSKVFGCQVVCFDSIDSTNIQAKVLAEQGCPHGTLVAADQQVSGKGRRGRTWESPKGSAISMSLVLRPTFAPNKASMLTLVMAISVANAIRDYDKTYGNNSWDVQIKWPNDIVVNGKKVCGILTEMSTEIDYINYVVIGVGINANIEEFPAELKEIATSLKLENQKFIDSQKLTEGLPNVKIEKNCAIQRARLVGAILKEFEEQYAKFNELEDLSFMQEAYNKMLVNSGREVKVLEPGNEYQAVAMGIDEEGQLEVRLTNGEEKKVYAGEVSVRGIYGYV